MESTPLLTRNEFREKYVNKPFSQKDLSGGTKFNTKEVKRYLYQDGGFQSPLGTRVPVFKLGKNIIKDHADMEFIFPPRMEIFWEENKVWGKRWGKCTCNVHLELKDNSSGKNYKIGVEVGDHGKWYLEVEKKKYRFCDPTQINLYFDTLKSKL